MKGMIAIKKILEKPLTLIQNGVLLYENLLKAGKSEPWVRETLSQLQIYDIRDVRYALLDPFGRVHVLFG